MPKEILNSHTTIKGNNSCAAFLFCGFFCVYLATVPGRLPEGDEGILLGVADRVAHSGFSSSPSGLNELQIFSSYGFFKDGYSKYGLGQSLILIPSTKAFRAAKSATNSVTYFTRTIAVYLPGPLIGAGVVTLFFLICRKLGYSHRLAFILSSLLGLTTMVWPYTQTLFSDPTMGFFWVLAFYALLANRDSRQNRWLILSGTAVGFAVLAKIVAACAVPIFCGYFLYQLINGLAENQKGQWGIVFLKPMAAFFLPMAAMGFVILKYNQLRYGSYLSFGYLDFKTYDVRDSIFGFNVPFLAGFYAQLLSSGKGFFFYNPLALMGLLGWNRFYRRHPAEAFFLLAMVGGVIVIYSKWYGWHGDWSWGLRYLSCLPPFFLLAAAPILENLIRTPEHPSKNLNWKRGTATVLICISLAVQILGLCIKSNDYILTAAEAEIFKGKFYRSDWPIRDDSLQLHFIPEFSPLAGHWWMIRVIRDRDNPSVKEIFESPPWRSLNPNWIPKKMNANRFRYHIWWLHILAADIKGTRGLLLFAGGLGLGFLICLGVGGIKVFRLESKVGKIHKPIA